MEFTIHGNIDNIVCDKNLMEITNKLDDGSWPKPILAEGAPGVVCLLGSCAGNGVQET